jgi:hypothetical protein
MPVDLERFFFLAAHQVDIELRDAYLSQAVQLLAMLLDGADDAEAIDDFVAHEIGVVAADFTVVEIVVFTAIFYKGGERRGQFFRLVFGDEVHHVVGDERGEPADMLARGLEVVGHPHRRGSHDFKFAEVTARFLCALTHEPEAPVDQVRIGELENHAVADAAGSAQRLRAVAGNPDRRNSRVRPGETRPDSVIVDGCAGIQFAEYIDELFEIFERFRGLWASCRERAVNYRLCRFPSACVRAKPRLTLRTGWKRQ